MSVGYLRRAVNTRGPIPQSKPVPGRESEMVQNAAGGYVFSVDDRKLFDRFLILGTQGGTYYASEDKLTTQNVDNIRRLIEKDPAYVVARIVEISTEGRAPKNDPAILALAMCASSKNLEARKAAFDALPKVCRTGTHLFHFVQFVDSMRGWGRGLREAVAKWYTEKDGKVLAYQLAKYQQRDGWSHRDLLRLAHPKPTSEDQVALFNWVVKGWNPEHGHYFAYNDNLDIITGMQAVKECQTAEEAVKYIARHKLPRECIPTQFLNSPLVWQTMLEKGSLPLTAMIRNLATMTRLGVITPLGGYTQMVVKGITDKAWLAASRVHPIQILSALITYKSGHSARGDSSWIPVGAVTDALDTAFYESFKNIEPTNKRWLLGIDVSGSMGGGVIAGVPGLTPRMGAAAMAMVTAKVEQMSHIIGFARSIVNLPITGSMRLQDVERVMSRADFGSTNCAAAIQWAYQNNVPVDVFAIYTDNETWAGGNHVHLALEQYRRKTDIDAKLVTVGMTASRSSIADPNDPGMLDVVGFDSATPNAISSFATM